MDLHYGQEVFEGLKAYRGKDGSLYLFRARDNFSRLNRSAARLCMPQVDIDSAMEALKKLILLDKDWVPRNRGTSLYIRPNMIATEPHLGVRPARAYLFYIIIGPVGAYYKEGLNPVKIYVEDRYVRAAVGGLGEVKTLANYAASLLAAEEAKKKGFTQVLWLDADRRVTAPPWCELDASDFAEFSEGTAQEVSTTMAFVRILRKLVKDRESGSLIVPIIPDEARTFGMESLFKDLGIYSSRGQLYEPVDHAMILRYHEARDGQILEEGITEAGATASLTAAGPAYATHGVPTVPFYIFYSMFGFQRIGDLVWAFGDSRGRGFFIGATAGRTTLQGEGLQHNDGHSQLLFSVVPNVRAYEPAYAYELAVIIRCPKTGVKR